MLFYGEFEARLDAKGRLVLPARIKAALPAESESNLILTRGFEPCITLHPLSEWNKILERVTALDEFNEEFRNFQRNYLRGNAEVELDSNGRFILPKSMMKYANIDKEVIVVGVGKRVELWDPETYNAYLVKDQQQLSKMAEKVLGQGNGAA